MAENNVAKNKMHPKKAMLWLSMVSMMMVFGGITSAMLVTKNPSWFDFRIPFELYVSTALILVSSITMTWAVASARRNRSAHTLLAMVLTTVLGLAFAYTQWEAWDVLVANDIHFVGKDASASYLYVLTGLHLAHLAAGIVVLFVVVWQAGRAKYNAGNMLGLELASIYWHFLDGLWIYLFLFVLYLVNAS